MLSIHCSRAKKHNLVLMGHVMRLCIRILVYLQSNNLMYNTMISHHKDGYSVQWLELEGPEPHVVNETHTTYRYIGYLCCCVMYNIYFKDIYKDTENTLKLLPSFASTGLHSWKC